MNLLLALVWAVLPGLMAPEDPPADPSPPSFEERVAGLEKRTGFLTLYLDPKKGRVYAEFPTPQPGLSVSMQMLYVEGLTTGLGSNPVGLDRGQLGQTRPLAVRRYGNKILFDVPNFSFRAMTSRMDEQWATRDSFATSVIWGGEVAAESEDGRLLVDITSFLVRDAHDVASTMESRGQGAFSLDESRSAVRFADCHVFPDNVELEAILTYSGKKPGAHVRSVTPDPKSVTLVQHHSFIRTPARGYRPRAHDPRAGSFSLDFRDYASPLTRPIEQQWIVRFRLEKTDPRRERSPVKKPIVFYVDRAAPEPVRSALVEGASWWADAFDAAGFVDAYRVELLPEDAHPLDVRYNVIQWVHRSTRGWSYGGGIVDPRTGERLKGHVTLGSLRVRQDRLLFEGLAGADKTGTGGADDPLRIALARIRQLAAHEVGHTLGFNHNFAASTYADRASVMDYPAPLIGITEDGDLDFSNAYGVGIGAWDKFAVKFAYTDFDPGVDEATALEEMIAQALKDGHVFLTDQDARPAGACHPLANLWDNGADPVDGLEQALAVRKIALEKFGAHCVATGRPLATLQEVLAPVYFHHRYQVDAAVKVLGGMEYAHALRGDGQVAARPVSSERQEKALEALLSCVRPEALDLPESVLSLLLPRPSGSSRNREMFASSTAPAFDGLGAAATAAGHVLGSILHPERCARLVDFRRRFPDQPGLPRVIQSLVRNVFRDGKDEPARLAAIRRTVREVLVEKMIRLSRDPDSPARVRAVVDYELRELAARLPTRRDGESREDWPHRLFLAARIQRYEARREEDPERAPEPAGPPPGSPIGQDVAFCSCGLFEPSR